MDTEITRSTVKEIKDRIVALESASNTDDELVDTDSVVEDEVMEDVVESSFDEEDIEGEQQQDVSPKWKNPVLSCLYNGRSAKVLLKKRPSDDGLVWIELEDGSVKEVNITKLKLFP